MRLVLAAALLAAAPSAFALDEDEAVAVPGVLTMSGLNLATVADAPLSLLGVLPRGIPKGAAHLGEVRGHACQFGVGVPISFSRRQSVNAVFGKGGFDEVVAEIKKKNPEVEGLFDIRFDVQQTGILGLFRRSCVELVARAWKRPS